MNQSVATRLRREVPPAAALPLRPFRPRLHLNHVHTFH